MHNNCLIGLTIIRINRLRSPTSMHSPMPCSYSSSVTSHQPGKCMIYLYTIGRTLFRRSYLKSLVIINLLFFSIELSVSRSIGVGLLCRLLLVDAAIRHAKRSIHKRSELSYVLNCDIPGSLNPDISLEGIA